MESCLFEVRDFLLLETHLHQIERGSYDGGRGPSQGDLIKVERERITAANIGKDLVDFGVHSDTMLEKENNWQFLKSRLKSAKQSSNKMKVRSSQTNNETKKTYAVSSSVSGKVNYSVVICKLAFLYMSRLWEIQN